MGGGRRAYLQRRHELASPQLLQPGRQFIRLKKCLMTVKNSLSPTETFLETKAGKLLNTCKSVENNRNDREYSVPPSEISTGARRTEREREETYFCYNLNIK